MPKRKDVRLSVVIQEFLRFKEETEGRAPTTVEGYRVALGRLRAVIGQDIYSWTLDEGHVDALRTDIAANAASTRNQYRIRMSEFVQWAYARDYLRKSHLMDGWRPAKVRERDKLWIHHQDVDLFLDAAPTPRSRIILATALFLVLRASEVSALRIGHVDLEGKLARCWIEKLDRWDEKPIIGSLDRELRRWFTYYTERVGPLRPQMFLVPAHKSRQGQPQAGGKFIRYAEVANDPTVCLFRPDLPARKLHKPIQEVLAACGYPTRQEGGHTLRRSGARIAYDNLVGRGHSDALRLVQTMLGHSKQDQTEVYIGLNADLDRRNRLFWEEDPFERKITGDNVVELRPRG